MTVCCGELGYITYPVLFCHDCCDKGSTVSCFSDWRASYFACYKIKMSGNYRAGTFNMHSFVSITHNMNCIGYMLHNEGSLHNNICEKTKQTLLYQHLFHFSVDATCFGPYTSFLLNFLGFALFQTLRIKCDHILLCERFFQSLKSLTEVI
jgi:hypothetical protein